MKRILLSLVTLLALQMFITAYARTDSVCPKGEHTYVNDVCSVCGWPVAGLYVNDKLELTWDQLLEYDYVREDNDVLTYVAPALYGTLVVREGIVDEGIVETWKDILLVTSVFKDHEKLNEVYLPGSVTVISNSAFYGCTSLEKVHVFGPVTEIGYSAFAECESLKSVEFHGTVAQEGIEDSAFYQSKALEEFTIPDTVKIIGDYAFYGCALKEVILPEGLKQIGSGAFTGIEELIIPESVTDFGELNVKYFDMSKTHITEIGDYYCSNCGDIVWVKFPKTLKIINAHAFEKCYSLELLVLPEGFTTISGKTNWRNKESLKTIVWPFSLKDASTLVQCPNLQTIYYAGSEFQWSLVNGNEKFDNVKIVFNYDGDGSEFFTKG